MEAESSPLLPVTDRTVARRRSYCKCTSFCIRSRPARWILLWNFAVLLSFKGLFSLEKVEQFNFITLASILANAVLVLFSIFSPVAGLLSDVKWSRYRAVLYSSRVIVILLLCLMMTALAMLTKYHFFLHTAATKYILTGIYGGVIPFSVIYITFIINTLQFGLDQLHDASTLDSVSYIHWYVWIYHTSSLVTSLFFNLLFYDASLFFCWSEAAVEVSHACRERPLALALLVPAQWMAVKSYGWKRRLHLPFTSFILSKYCKHR